MKPFYSMTDNLRNAFFFLIALVCTMALSSCDNDLEDSTTTTQIIGTESTSTDFILYIHDKDGNPIQGAHIDVAGTDYCSTADGLAIIRNLTIPSLGQVIEITAPHYLTAIGRLQSVDNGQNFASLLLTKISDATTPVSNGIAVSHDIAVSYPDTLIDTNSERVGSPTASAIASNSNLNDNIFSNRISEDSDARLSLIKSEIELTLITYDDNGDLLTLPQDSVVIITVSGINTSEDSLSYFQYSTSSQLWDASGYFYKQEGTDTYIGQIHTANFKIVIGSPVLGEFLLFKAVDKDAFGLNNLPYIIKDSDTNKYLASGKTDHKGYGKVLVPANASVELVPYISSELGDPVQIVSGLDTAALQLSIDGTAVSGSVLLCNTTPDSSAMISYSQGTDLSFVFADESSYQATLLQDGAATFQAYNPDLLSKSEKVIVASPSDGEVIGPLTLCEPLETNETIVISTNITEDTQWRNCNTYILNGLIYLEPSTTLTIEEGTIIKAELNQGGLSSALVVSRGARINARGTASAPIIFTSVLDEITTNQIISPSLDKTDSGLWAGVILLGDAPVSAASEPAVLLGLDNSESLNFYGGTTAEDDSGILSFVSIRHTGADLNGSTPAGLTVAGLGTGTDLNHIEILGAAADGLAIYGGGANLSNILVNSSSNNAVKIDQAYSGQLSNFIVILNEKSRSGFTLEGGEGTMQEGATLVSGSVRGQQENTMTPSDYFIMHEAARGRISNCYFFSFSEQSKIVIRDTDTANNYLIDSLVVENIALDTTNITNENSMVADFFLDQSGLNVFASKPTNTQLVQGPTFGASKNVFFSWSCTDATGMLDDF